MNNTYAYDKEAFLQSFVLSRTSHKKDIVDLMKEALYAWNKIQESLKT